MERITGSGVAYNFPLVFRLRGDLDLDALRAALRDVSGRHEALRTVFREHDGEPYQHIVPAAEAEPGLTVTDCAEAALDTLIETAQRRPFDLDRELPLRCEVFRVGPADHVVAVVLHHITTDEWSDRPFLADLNAAYAARRRGPAPDWAPLPVQYADYTLWQERVARTRSARPNSPTGPTRCATSPKSSRCRWTGRAPPSPPDAAAPCATSCPPSVGLALRDLSGATGTSMFMLLQAATAALLHRLGAGEDIPLGRSDRGPHGQRPRRPGRLLRQHARPAHRPVRRGRRHSVELLGRVRESTWPRSSTRTCPSTGWWRPSTRRAWPAATRCSR